MVTYKEFEILNYLTRFQGNTNGAFLAYLEQHLFWRVDKLKVPENELPVKDQELLIHIPTEKIYLVSK